MANDYRPFETWAQLLDHVRAGYRLLYQAPLDFQPVTVTAVIRKDGKLRVVAPFSDADPFTADAGHLSRFRRSFSNRVTA